MQEATLCYLVDDDEVLLIEKRRGLGSGLYNGPGGKIEPGETPGEAIRREVDEEVGLEIIDPEKLAELSFTHDGEQVLFVHVFRATEYNGQARPSPEANPVWFTRDELPYDEMWEDDHLWLPHVLDGDQLIGEFSFEGGKTLDEADFVEYDLELDPDSFDGP